MDNLSRTSNSPRQRLEVFTELFVIHGSLNMTSGRTSDVLNRTNTDFVPLHEGTITPLGQVPNPKALDSPVMIRRTLILFIAEMSLGKPAQPVVRGSSGSLAGREAYVEKTTFACYTISGPFAIYGQCYLHQGTSLENLLQGVDLFFPVTKATIYVLNRPDLTWQRDLVVMNKSQLTAMYLLP